MTQIRRFSSQEFRNTPSNEVVKILENKKLSEINDYGSTIDIVFSDGAQIVVSIDDYSNNYPVLEVGIFEELEEK